MVGRGSGETFQENARVKKYHFNNCINYHSFLPEKFKMENIINVLGSDYAEFVLTEHAHKNGEIEKAVELNELLIEAHLSSFDDLENGEKIELKACIFSGISLVDTIVTIRKTEGRGDRRFCVSNLNSYTKPGDKLIIWVKDEGLIIVTIDPAQGVNEDIIENLRKFLANIPESNSKSQSNGEENAKGISTTSGKGIEGKNKEDATVTENYLVQIRKLQQDREDAISTPKSWAIPPLLEVSSKLDNSIERLMESTTNGINEMGEWFFMVGSPGNGKSAYCGKYYRGLRDRYDFKFRRKSENKSRLLEELNDNEIPYKIEVCKKGEKYSCCWILQDASVLENTYDEKAEPANDLLKQMLKAKEKGVSLIACTNRGVLETAFNFLKSKKEFSGPKWEKIDKVISNTVEGKNIIKGIDVGDKEKASFKKVAVYTESLDAESLLIGEETFSKLIENATADEKWISCKKCEWANKCPLVQNRDTIANKDGKESLLNILKRTEALSGQVIVFRAAISLISYILSGCARDQGDLSPCNWVHEQIKKKAYFNLLSRRIYMQLFCSDVHLGLDENPTIQKGQLDALHSIVSCGGGISSENKEAVEFATKKKNWLTTNVGLKSLIGKGGSLSKLDPIQAPLNQHFLDKWGGNCESLEKKDYPWVGGLEIKCGSIFNELTESLEDPTINNSVEHYRILSRWITAYTIRLGGFKESITRHDDSLDKFLRALQISRKEIKTPEDDQFSDYLQEKLQIAFNCTDKDGYIKLNENFGIHSEIVTAKLKAKIKHNPKSIQLWITVNKKDFPMSGNLFIWIMKMKDEGLIETSLPEAILDKLRDCRDRSAASINYSTIDDIKLRTNSEMAKNKFTFLKRNGNNVYKLN
ncbi:hypothetical protein OAH15_00350 [bacterium]|nr:hypothetical protein [bacterium]